MREPLHAGKRRKIIVLIPTHNRPNYLEITMASVAEQGQKFGHDVEIVISDTSKGKEPESNRLYAELNEDAVEKVRTHYLGVPVHYYPPRMPNPIAKLLNKTSSAERNAYASLVPKDGHWGAHRNRLALLAAYHGSESAAYLHLDDDTPILKIKPGSYWKGHDWLTGNTNFLAEPKGDIIASFLRGLEKSSSEGKAGFGGWIVGVHDGLVSGGNASLMTKQNRLNFFDHPSKYDAGRGYGPGRILQFEAMKTPYPPYNRSSDFHHSNKIGGLSSQPYSEQDDAPIVAHIGTVGEYHEELAPVSRLATRKKDEALYAQWKKLVERMERLGQKQKK